MLNLAAWGCGTTPCMREARLSFSYKVSIAFFLASPAASCQGQGEAGIPASATNSSELILFSAVKENSPFCLLAFIELSTFKVASESKIETAIAGTT